ncbi:MAG: very short patch repair endonuclease [Verrucomicrobiota bacterium]|nr:very short patch repair endonuclease [Verrucomicrobiota bacterium]
MDTFSQRERSRIMASVRSTGNKSTELKLIGILRREHLKGWRRKYNLSGKPDLVYPRQKLVIFIDGCFWHGCQKCYRRPNSRQEYWDAKVKRNTVRDAKVSRTLKSNGWKVFRVWEHDLKISPGKLIFKLKKLLGERERKTRIKINYFQIKRLPNPDVD